LLASRIDAGDEVAALTMFYGQRHAKEIQAARAIASHYQVAHIEMDLSQIFKFGDVSALMANSRIPLPKGSYRPDGVQSTYVPFRNGLFLSTAAALALQLDCEAVFYGAHADDAARDAYPDCSVEFAESMALAVNFGTGGKIFMWHRSSISRKLMLSRAELS
jgi:7-cyano-7-deazaguanine synthase